MGIDCAARRTRLVVVLFTFTALWGFTLSITRYSIPEEMEEGSFVANLATDLGLDVRSLEERNAKLDVIHVVSVSDKDSGMNGVVDLTLNQQDILPFLLNKSSEDYFELLVSKPLDREVVSKYELVLIVTDRGVPPLSDNETITLEILDVNDNAPTFSESVFTIHVMENNPPGALLTSLSAFDPDLNENQYLVYFIMEKEIVNMSMSMLFSINPENGDLYAMKTFDYERERDFLFHIEARDSGIPPLSSNTTHTQEHRSQRNHGLQSIHTGVLKMKGSPIYNWRIPEDSCGDRIFSSQESLAETFLTQKISNSCPPSLPPLQLMVPSGSGDPTH
ncbi:hypothetical protein OJAV_G00138030 [Oryzias javanicus]|uniref:Cadherin domain-containing protein n=1 Tax=Oryzias javanicus TaxID=123683 RepID=A0A3S2P3T9_ORYJA|nr:hypothetical protein OJAV_G00138030 [Oryzias javanicus]